MVKLDLANRLVHLRSSRGLRGLDIVNEYEGMFGFVSPTIENNDWYRDYLSKFVKYCDHFCQPEALPDAYDREVLFAMICGSPLVDIRIDESNELFKKDRLHITYTYEEYDPREGYSTTETFRFYYDELNEDQIDYFFDLFIESNLGLYTDLEDFPEEEQEKAMERIEKRRAQALDFIRTAVTGNHPLPFKRPAFRNRRNDYETVYHYTSLSTLEAILKGNSLRASDIRKLNDKKEMSIWFDVFEDAFSRFRQKKNYYTYEKTLIAIRDKVYEKRKEHYYTISLSRAGDLLSQWNLYGDQGKGVCIAFDELYLELMMSRRGVDHFELSYDFEDTSWKIYKMIYNDLYLDSRFQPSESMLDATADRIFKEMKRMKDPSFFAEQESRFMCSRKNSVRHFFMRKGQKVHYRDFRAVRRLPITGIMLGPCVEDADNVILRINALLKEAGLKNVPVSVSSIPFRS